LKTGLALGAHDTNGIKANITLKITNGSESFIPLGKKDKTEIFPGEYCYVDDDNNVICRMEVLQVEPTKITTETENIFLIIQGNRNTEQSYVNETAQILCNTIVKYCGGSCKLI
jgi:DNA/RNA-binding domain of Phe-tRNA-synthetase-like protein